MKPARFTFLFAALVSFACGDDAMTGPETKSFALDFRAVVGAEDARCGQSYSGVGSTGTSFTLSDFRFYVHDIRLIDASGGATPLALEQDGLWQSNSLALLDFEDASATCQNGTAETNTTVRGSAVEGDYTGVRFTLGVPFEANHQDAASAASPLNLTSLFWNWSAGYKFVRIDGTTDGLPTGFRFHLGSTACQMDSDGVVTACGNPNRVEVELSAFDSATQTIVADFSTLVADADIDVNTASTAPGCQSMPDDPECAAIFSNLGLPFGGSTPGAQSFFRVE